MALMSAAPSSVRGVEQVRLRLVDGEERVEPRLDQLVALPGHLHEHALGGLGRPVLVEDEVAQRVEDGRAVDVPDAARDVGVGTEDEVHAHASPSARRASPGTRARARLNSMPQCGKTMRMSAFLRAALMASNASLDLQGSAPALVFGRLHVADGDGHAGHDGHGLAVDLEVAGLGRLLEVLAGTRVLDAVLVERLERVDARRVAGSPGCGCWRATSSRCRR